MEMAAKQAVWRALQLCLVRYVSIQWRVVADAFQNLLRVFAEKLLCVIWEPSVGADKAIQAAQAGFI